MKMSDKFQSPKVGIIFKKNGCKMAAKVRLSSEDRRDSIVKAVIPLFEEKGFNGTTTRELAAAAGVSEALMYKHFPSKKDLYAEMQNVCCENKEDDLSKLEMLPDSSESMVICFYLFLKRVIDDDEKVYGELNRLMLSSLLDDGEFARVLLDTTCSRWREKMITCLKAAAAKGEVDEQDDEDCVNIWLLHHMTVCVLMFRTPSEGVIDYKMNNGKLIDQIMTFALRGLGMSRDFIKQIYDREALDKMLEV